VFESYWERDEDVSNDDVLKKIFISSGLRGEEILKSIKQQDIKDRLKNNTSELIKRGGFGSPTIFINKEDMYFGNDRMELIRYKLSKLSIISLSFSFSIIAKNSLFPSILVFYNNKQKIKQILFIIYSIYIVLAPFCHCRNTCLLY
jgi:hypothetical protein